MQRADSTMLLADATRNLSRKVQQQQQQSTARETVLVLNALPEAETETLYGKLTSGLGCVCSEAAVSLRLDVR